MTEEPQHHPGNNRDLSITPLSQRMSFWSVQQSLVIDIVIRALHLELLHCSLSTLSVTHRYIVLHLGCMRYKSEGYSGFKLKGSVVSNTAGFHRYSVHNSDGACQMDSGACSVCVCVCLYSLSLYHGDIDVTAHQYHGDLSHYGGSPQN